MNYSQNRKKKIAIFGSSWPEKGHPVYENAYDLGQILAKEDYIILNGGYLGTMEATSRGAFENNGYVVGFPCDEIENWRPVKPNRWLSEEKRFPSLRSRLMAMVDSCDAGIALYGGIGTLAEVFMMWNHLLVQAISPKPLILIGAEWEIVIRQLFNSMDEYIPHSQRDYIQITTNNENAVDILNKILADI